MTVFDGPVMTAYLVPSDGATQLIFALVAAGLTACLVHYLFTKDRHDPHG